MLLSNITLSWATKQEMLLISTASSYRHWTPGNCQCRHHDWQCFATRIAGAACARAYICAQFVWNLRHCRYLHGNTTTEKQMFNWQLVTTSKHKALAIAWYAGMPRYPVRMHCSSGEADSIQS